MKIPKIKIVKLPEGQKSRFAFIIRSIMVFNIFFCAGYIYNNSPGKPNTKEIEDSEFKKEAEKLAE
jgi:hypothetical protein